MRNFTKNRQKQEDEDATFARAIQEEEEARAQYPDQYPDQNPSSPTSRMENGPGNPTRERHSRNGLIPTFAVCDGVVIMPIRAFGNFYHMACFKCIGYHDQISKNERFAYTQSEDGKKYPLYKQCYAELYGLKGTVCQSAMEADANGRGNYLVAKSTSKEVFIVKVNRVHIISLFHHIYWCEVIYNFIQSIDRLILQLSFVV